MNLLLDTCALLWALQEPEKLSPTARRALENAENPIYISTVSFWEISLKHALGKLELENAVPEDFPDFVRSEGWEIVPLSAEIAASYGRVPRVPEHRDPFDRILINLAIREQWHLVSSDAATSAYLEHGLKVCW